MNGRNIDIDIDSLYKQIQEKLSTMTRCWVLDIDENLFLMTVDEDRDSQSILSRSAEHELSHSTEIKKPTVANNYDGEWVLLKATALSRKKWQSYFDAIVECNRKYYEAVIKIKGVNQQITPLLAVIFLTNASYQREYFLKNVFNKIYTDSLMQWLNPLFFNRIDQLNTVGEINKGKYMDFIYQVLCKQAQYDWSSRAQIKLIDDNVGNIDSAKDLGFSVVHNATNTVLRNDWQSYEKEKEAIFSNLDEDIENLKKISELLEKLDALLKIKKEKKSQEGIDYNKLKEIRRMRQAARAQEAAAIASKKIEKENEQPKKENNSVKIDFGKEEKPFSLGLYSESDQKTKEIVDKNIYKIKEFIGFCFSPRNKLPMTEIDAVFLRLINEEIDEFLSNKSKSRNSIGMSGYREFFNQLVDIAKENINGIQGEAKTQMEIACESLAFCLSKAKIQDDLVSGLSEILRGIHIASKNVNKK